MGITAAIARLAIVVAFVSSLPAFAQDADAVLVNGKIITLAGETAHEALAVRDGKVLSVSHSSDIRSFAGPSTIDLGRN